MREPDAHAGDVARQVWQVVGRLIADGADSRDIRHVAEAMGTSVRTLQRRLHAAGLTYAGVVQQVRCAAARELLTSGRGRIGDVARMLGYSDPAHFTRAFQRWTGQSPRAYRGSGGRPRLPA